MRDIRDPEKIGESLARLKEIHPELSAIERHDLIEEGYKASHLAIAASNGHYTTNGSSDGS